MKDTEGIAKAMNEVWLQAMQDVTPDLIWCAPVPAHAGNWARFICKLTGHRWKPLDFLNVTHKCRLCHALAVEKWNLPELDQKVYDWWKNESR